MKTIVTSLEESGDILDDNAAHALELHLSAVNQYEKKNQADKVIKHMNGFKVLIDSQKENELITKNAHEMLQAKADAMIKIWE
ncbi:FIMAH domain-containing protein [Virgibacillus ndiopensis]|uniref:FIMAH domain-containing protein n=1 Tax=Virgibacillus ndiopensis TaxID=2004408 RepID=UPI003CCC3816